MNNKPINMKKIDRLEIRLTSKDKEYILETAKSKSSSISDLVVDSIRAGRERRTKKEKRQVAREVIQQNLLNIIEMKQNQGISIDSELKELERVRMDIWK